MVTRVGVIYDPVYLEHDTGDHVENAQRLIATTAYIQETFKGKFCNLPPRPATIEEISAVHAREYILYLRQRASKGGGWLDPDTVISQSSYNAAIYAAGGAIAAVDAVLNRQVDCAFALVRPPGHHASCWQAMGFCLFNNIAIATKYALANFDIKRVLIVDFDVHHGNGTQDAFYADPHVLYFSTHQYPLFPGTGTIDETGTKQGEGFTVNVPLLAGWGDEEYQAVFEDILAPIARRFEPQLIMVSAGYDAHWADPLAQMQLSVSGFARLVEILKTLANLLCQGRLVLILEGGYHLQALSLSVGATLAALSGSKNFDDALGKPKTVTRPTQLHNFLQMLKQIHHI